MVQNYKIFIKDVPLLLASELNGQPGKVIQLDEKDLNTGFIENIMMMSQHKHPNAFFLSTAMPEATMEKLKQLFQLVQASGGIVWNKDSKLLMIFRRGKWDLPKGKVEEGESLETAALREVEEESGVGKLRIVERFDTTYHIYKEANVWVLKETYWFEMLSQDEGATIPQKSEGITSVKWVARDEIGEKLKNTYASIRDLVQSVLERGYTAGQH